MSAEPRVRVGTEVVLRDGVKGDGGPGFGRGLAGRVVRDNGGSFAVSLADGRLVDAELRQLDLRDERGSDGISAALDADPSELVTKHAIYAAVTGSRVYGVDLGEPDADTRAVYQAPSTAFWSLRKPPKHVAGPGPTWFSWEVERFCELALKANPGCLEMLWSPLTIWVTDAGRELLELRGAFLSKAVSTAYAEYVRSQFDTIEAGLSQHRDIVWTTVTHLLLLQIGAAELLRTGNVGLAVAEYREPLLAVRAGQMTWERVTSWRATLERKLDDAVATSWLPDGPDTHRVDVWLSDLRRRAARDEL